MLAKLFARRATEVETPMAAALAPTLLNDEPPAQAQSARPARVPPHMRHLVRPVEDSLAIYARWFSAQPRGLSVLEGGRVVSFEALLVDDEERLAA